MFGSFLTWDSDGCRESGALQSILGWIVPIAFVLMGAFAAYKVYKRFNQKTSNYLFGFIVVLLMLVVFAVSLILAYASLWFIKPPCFF